MGREITVAELAKKKREVEDRIQSAVSELIKFFFEETNVSVSAVYVSVDTVSVFGEECNIINCGRCIYIEGAKDAKAFSEVEPVRGSVPNNDSKGTN